MKFDGVGFVDETDFARVAVGAEVDAANGAADSRRQEGHHLLGLEVWGKILGPML